jgi:hypothetical protein
MINSKIIKIFIQKALDELEGNWVIIGGTVLTLLGIEDRVTVDIDMISLSPKNSNEKTLKLMEIAELIGLPVETINQSGEYYLHKIPDFKKELVLFAESKKCKIYRPNAYLFFYLKISRLTETDCSDCSSFVKKNRIEVLKYKNKILKLINIFYKNANSEKKKRLNALEKELIDLI